jgi:hypothetical protein
MTPSQIRYMVNELAEDVRAFLFQALDAEIWIQGEEAGRVASAIEQAFREEMDRVLDIGESTLTQRLPSRQSARPMEPRCDQARPESARLRRTSEPS